MDFVRFWAEVHECIKARAMFLRAAKGAFDDVRGVPMFPNAKPSA